MTKVLFTIDNRFLEDVRAAVLRFAGRAFPKLSADDREDLVQDALMELYQNVKGDNLPALDCKLSTYVIGIFKNMAFKKLQEQSKYNEMMPMIGQDEDDVLDPVDLAIARDAVERWHDADGDEEHDQLSAAMREMVENMQEPCKTILWSFYWEGKSMKVIADEMKYNNPDVAKTQKSRCMTKAKVALADIQNKLRL